MQKTTPPNNMTLFLIRMGYLLFFHFYKVLFLVFRQVSFAGILSV